MWIFNLRWFGSKKAPSSYAVHVIRLRALPEIDPVCISLTIGQDPQMEASTFAVMEGYVCVAGSSLFR